MFKSTIRILLTLTVIAVFGSSLLAQDQNTQDFKAQWERIFSRANETAVFENGKITSLKQPILNGGEKHFSFIHAEDGKSFTLTDENGLGLQVFLYEDRRIQSIVMPNGEKVDVTWKQTSSGDLFPENLKCNNNSMEAPEDGNNPCRDAIIATAIAIGVCTASPGSAACWAATANAAYHTYRCWEATQFAFSPTNTEDLMNYARRFEFRQKSSNKERIAKNLKLLNN